MSAKRGLGKGIDRLFGGGEAPAASADVLSEAATRDLHPGGFQPRRTFPEESLAELADSIRARGVIQPIIVRPRPDGKKGYEIIAGERRWQAAKRAGLKRVPVRVREYDDRQALYAALVENLQREDLNAVDLARGVRRLVEEFKLSHADAAKGIGLARASVTNLLRILGLHPAALKLVENGPLEMGHARALAGLPAGSQKLAAEKVARLRLSVRQTEELVKRILAGDGKKKPAKRADPDVANLADEITRKLGSKTSIVQTGKGKGRLVIHYRSLDALDKIIRKLGK